MRTLVTLTIRGAVCVRDSQTVPCYMAIKTVKRLKMVISTGCSTLLCKLYLSVKKIKLFVFQLNWLIVLSLRALFWRPGKNLSRNSPKTQKLEESKNCDKIRVLCSNVTWPNKMFMFGIVFDFSKYDLLMQQIQQMAVFRSLESIKML